MVLSILYALFLLPPDAPPAGILEQSDRGLGDQLAQAKRSDGPGDLRPPRDRAADTIDADRSRTRPVLATRKQAEVAAMAEGLGRPVVWWTFWPDTYDTTAGLFLELAEAQHVLMPAAELEANDVGAGEYLVYTHRDGRRRWVKASDVFGKECAAGIRKAWQGERKPIDAEGPGTLTPRGDRRAWWEGGDPKRLTSAERDEVLAARVPVDQAGRPRRVMTLRDYLDLPGHLPIPAEQCRGLGFTSDQAAYAIDITTIRGPRARPAEASARPAGGSVYGTGRASPASSPRASPPPPPRPAPARGPIRGA